MNDFYLDNKVREGTIYSFNGKSDDRLAKLTVGGVSIPCDNASTSPQTSVEQYGNNVPQYTFRTFTAEHNNGRVFSRFFVFCSAQMYHLCDVKTTSEPKCGTKHRAFSHKKPTRRHKKTTNQSQQYTEQ